MTPTSDIGAAGHFGGVLRQQEVGWQLVEWQLVGRRAAQIISERRYEMACQICSSLSVLA